MAHTQVSDSETAEQLKAFYKAFFSGGNPRSARLVEQFRHVSHQMYRLGEASLNESGLSYAQYRTLMLLFFEEWRGNCGGMNPSKISERQGTGRNNISALVRGLEEDGLVERRLDEDDRRRFNIVLTDEGRQRVRQLAALHMKSMDALFAAFSDEEMETLRALLTRLNASAESCLEE